MKKAKIEILYAKRMPFPFKELKEVKAKDYVTVYEKEKYIPPNHNDYHVLNAHFELFNWIHEGFQPNDPVIGFDRNGADHTSMSVGDIIKIDGKAYICKSAGWGEVKVVA